MQRLVSDMTRFVRELRRRRVFRVGIAYLIAGWVVVQVADVVFDAAQLPVWTKTFVLIVIALGFPIALVLAWAFDLTPHGIERTSAATGAGTADDAAAPVRAAVPASPLRASANGTRSIAVLPFANMSADPENDYFSDGMAEELLNALTRIRGLHVAARTSCFAFKNRNEDVRTITQQLDVGTVLEGSVRKSGSRLRITAQLIDARNGYHLWSETYDREMVDIFEIQEDISRSIVGALEVKLAHGNERPVIERRTDDLQAYNLYLKGRYRWNQRTDAGLRGASACFEEAIRRDPDYALAHAGLADALTLQGIAEYGLLPPSVAMPRAKQAAQRALELDPRMAEPHTTLGHIAGFYDWRWVEAEREFRRSIELKPDYAFAHHWYALLLAAQARHDEAIAAEHRALELEPLSLIINKNVGTIYYYARRYAESIEQYRRALELAPDFTRTRLYIGLAHVAEGAYDAAFAEYDRALTLSGRNSVVLAAIGHAQAMAGDRAAAAAVLDEFEQRRAADEYVPAFNSALVHAGLGDVGAACDWLERALAERSSWIVSLKVEPALDRLRGHARFEELVRRALD